MNPNEISQRIRALSPEQRELLARRLDVTPDQPSGAGGARLIAYVVGAADLSTVDLRNELKARLPEYMVPAAFVLLNEMPRLPNGKIDLSALPEPAAAAPAPDGGPAAPRTPVEQQLTEIWEQVLNIRPIGIHDNFFEIGGDSILSIQIVARARKAGLLLGPNQLFDHQTIAELALFAQPAGEKEPAEASGGGPLPLTPIQHWFFEEHRAAPHHWNQSILLPVAPEVTAVMIERVVQQLIRQHEALRLQFTSRNGAWGAIIHEPGPLAPVRHIDLSGLPEAEQDRAVRDYSAAVQAGLRFAEGSLFQAVFFQMEPARRHRLLLVAHHLLVDTVSWQILLQDIDMALRQERRGEAIVLPARTLSCKGWSDHLTGLARSGRFEPEYGFWLQQTRDAPTLPAEPGAKLPVPEASMELLTVELDAATTHRLLKEAPAAYRMRPDELLIAALLQTLAPWAGTPTLSLGLERHGREAAGADLDLSNTIGWFTAFFPLLLHLPAATEAGAVLKSVKEQLRQAPDGGIGYGVLRYLSQTPEAKYLRHQPPVIFNYLGVQNPIGAELLHTGQLVFEASRDPRSERYSLFEINALVTPAARLEVRWSYSRELHRAETVGQLAAAFERALRELIDHCVNYGQSEYTPSDFPEANLSQEDLDQLLGQLNL